MLAKDGYIIGADPGRTTGLVVLQYQQDYEFNLTAYTQVDWENRFQLKTWLSAYSPVIGIAVESFKLYPDKARHLAYDDFPSSQVIGIIEAYATEAGLMDLICYQSAAQRIKVKVLPRDYQLIKFLPHACDAYRHARLFLINEVSCAKSALSVPRRSDLPGAA